MAAPTTIRSESASQSDLWLCYAVRGAETAKPAVPAGDRASPRTLRWLRCAVDGVVEDEAPHHSNTFRGDRCRKCVPRAGWTARLSRAARREGPGRVIEEVVELLEPGPE
jgi:hypothetical protein